MVAVDLKVIGDKNILWMICGFTKFIRGVVLKDKTPESVIQELHGPGVWICDFQLWDFGQIMGEILKIKKQKSLLKTGNKD